MISFAKKQPRRVFLFGGNSLHMRWAAASSGLQLKKWQRMANAKSAELMICEGPWTQERAFILRKALNDLMLPRMMIFSGAISLQEQTVLEGLLDHVDVFLPEGIEQFWRADTQELILGFLSSKSGRT